MSAVKKVAQAVIDRGEATAADLDAVFMDMTAAQIRSALKNATRCGLIRIVRRGLWKYHQPGLATYGPAVEPKPPAPVTLVVKAAPSVFALSCGSVRITAMVGRQYQPLGGWSE